MWGRLLLPWASEAGGRALEGRPQRAAQRPSGHRSSEQPKGPGARAGAAREMGGAGHNVGPVVGAGPGVSPERQPVGLNLQ